MPIKTTFRTYPDLKLRFLWLCIGYALIFLVLYLSLTSAPVELKISYPYQDKFFHAFAYFVLMTWFSQIYHDRVKHNFIAMAFVCLGVIIEYLQGFDPNRYFEFADMLANSIGVALGFFITLTGAKNILLHFENWLRDKNT